MGVGRRLDQLGGHPNPVSLPPHRAFDDVTDPERLGDLRQGERRALERHHAGAGDHLEALDLGQLADDLFGDALAEILVPGVAVQVVERQHRD
jgi:hypothetical protein